MLERMMDAHLPGPTSKEFGALVRQLRTQQALSLHELALRSGLSADTVAALEAGDGDPSFDEMSAVSRGLGMELSAIFRMWQAEQARVHQMH